MEETIQKRTVVHDVILIITAIALFLFFYFLPT